MADLGAKVLLRVCPGMFHFLSTSEKSELRGLQF